MVFEIGRVCVKLAGRDAGKKCIIVKKIDETFCLVDGQTRRRKVNQNHLEALNDKVEIKEDASNSEVVTALKAIGIECKEKVEKEKKVKGPRPKKQKIVKNKDKSTKKKVTTKKVSKEPKKSESKGDEK